MTSEAQTRKDAAMALEDDAARNLQSVIPEATTDQVIQIAQAQATLALGQRVAQLTETLEKSLRDVESAVDG